MADIYIVNVATGGQYAEQYSYYHRTEAEGQESFAECLRSVGEDHTAIELIHLETENLETTTLRWWEGTCEELEGEGPEDGETGFEDEDDWIVEGRPEGGE